MDTSNEKPNNPQERRPFADEEEIKILERRLQLLREGLKPIGDIGREQKETQKNPEGTFQGEGPGSAPPPPASTPLSPPADTRFHDVKAQELKGYATDKQLNALVEVALEKSLHDAIDIARRLDDAYLLDEFHDVLMDDEALHKQLVERGKL